MSGDYLKTARVLVVDDQPEEALPIMLALSKFGIGYIYLKGNIEEIPLKPLKGIRLVFLDLRLELGGDSNYVLPKTVNVLKNLVSPETTPLLIICWTKHEEDFRQFSKMAMAAVPGLKPGFIKKMPKPKTEIESWNESELGAGIKTIIEHYPAVQILWDWEQMVHEAITETTQVLADAVKKDNETVESGNFQKEWMNNLLKVLRALVKAETGQTATKTTAPRALFNVLNTLASDRLSHKFADEEISYANIILPQENESISDDEKATLNRMILTEPIPSGDSSVRPGNIYEPDAVLKGNCLHAVAKLDFEKLAGQMLEKKIEHLPYSNVRPIFLEISPFCDYSQNNRPVSRFIAGILVPEAHKKSIKKAPFMYSLPLLFLDESEVKNKWIPIFNSRFQFGVPVELVHNIPLCRIRSQALVDIQAWAASQSARPGKLSI